MRKYRRWGLLALYALASPVRAQEEPRSCAVNGTVADAEFGSAISGASVWLERLDGDLVAGETTSTDGAFTFDLETCEPVVLRAAMIGFESVEHPLAFEGGPGQYHLAVQLARAPLEVAELRVEVPRSSRLQETGFYARRAWVESTGRDYADFYDPDEVAGRTEAMHSVTAIALRSRIRFIYGGCRPSVYVDGRLIPGPGSRSYWDRVNRAVDPDEVEGIEIYRALSSAVPEEFRDLDSTQCGAVVIWTKRGGV